ncbi:hypothetical protein ACQ4N7_01205 [Nodosilinea sp. AN01ver1]|uniref:hypothetical protein n=1 Tax=Nodosilinea sp. AN01ver1 TaxID=3423362 RepID=UPI003D32176C
MTAQYTYRAYWREQGDSEWNTVTSNQPISWQQQIIPGSGNPQAGGDFSKYGGVTISGFSINNNRTITLNVLSYSFRWTYSDAPAAYPNGQPYYGGYSLIGIDCIGNTVMIPELRSITYYENGSIYSDNNAISSLRFIGSEVCGPGEDFPGVDKCQTTFSTGLVVTREQCIEVTLEPQDECPCCTALLAKASAILARL